MSVLLPHILEELERLRRRINHLSTAVQTLQNNPNAAIDLSLPDNNIFVGNSSNQATPTPLSAVSVSRLGSPVSEFSVNNQRVTNLAAPINNDDAVRKIDLVGLDPANARKSFLVSFPSKDITFAHDLNFFPTFFGISAVNKVVIPAWEHINQNTAQIRFDIFFTGTLYAK